MKSWIKSYTETNHDPKILTLTWAQRGIWATLLNLAGEMDVRDPETEIETGEVTMQAERTALSDAMQKDLMRRWLQAGLLRGARWGRYCDNYERGKAIVDRAAKGNSRLYRAGLDLLAEYLEI